MGYVVRSTVYDLEFEKHPGLEIRAGSVDIDGYTEILKLADAMTTTPTQEQTDELFTWFLKRLRSWNLEVEVTDDDGEVSRKPVPRTLEGLRTLELPFVLEIVMAWVKAITGVPGPLGGGSGGGARPPGSPGPRNPVEESIPMTPVSASPSS